MEEHSSGIHSQLQNPLKTWGELPQLYQLCYYLLKFIVVHSGLYKYDLSESSSLARDVVWDQK
jgi:hypothetical protein